MLASYYQITVDLNAMKRLCKPNIRGTNLERLLSAFRELGFKAQAFKGDIKEKKPYKLPFPCIAHITRPWLGIKIKHYVIVSNKTEQYIEIWDPNPKIGIKKLTYAEFLKIWTGYIIVVAIPNPLEL
jgi:ATP-binding cassette subfamily C protein/competence factor transporting protein